MEILLKTLSASGSPDLRVCGTAALTSAILYRLKVETMFLFERFKPVRMDEEPEEPPLIILLPFRYELRSTAMEELLIVFERVVEETLSQKMPTKQSSVVAEIGPEIEVDLFIESIKEMLASFRTQLFDALRQKGAILFNEFVEGFTLLEKARRFILLLFLATEGAVSLEQLDEDIRIVGVAETATV